jgi:hypothetical protein
VAKQEDDPCGDFERAAARVVARLTCGEAVLQDDGSSNGLIDIGLKYPDGRKAVVEVWTASDGDYAAMQRHLRAPPPKDPRTPFLRYPRHLSAPALGRVWDLSVSPTARVKRLVETASTERQGLERVLQRLEASGDTFKTVSGQLPSELRALGIEEASWIAAAPGGGDPAP